MVRLISLEIVNFKQLQKGQIKWNPSARGLSAISVRDFYRKLKKKCIEIIYNKKLIELYLNL